MFRNRNNSQKPNDELLAAFKQTFTNLGQNAAPSSSKEANEHGQPAASTSITDPTLIQPTARQAAHAMFTGDGADADNIISEQIGDHDTATDNNITPSRFAMESWRLTPSMFDQNAFPMAQMGNTPLGYYTPSSGGANNVFHNQTAGDLHTPGLSFQLNTPLSMPVQESSLQPGPSFDQSFNAQLFGQHGFDTGQMFAQHPHSHHLQHLQQQQQPQHHLQSQQHQHAQHQLVPPSMLIHKDSGIGGTENSPVPGAMNANDPMAQHESEAGYVSKSTLWPDDTSLEQFRYHITLNAPTAMVRSKDEVPITYLNKGQAYTLSIFDSLPVAPPPRRVRYRTKIRISFEEEEQRAKPSSCWQLWKEGRGLAEAHQRAGKLQAVEFVDPHPGAAEDDPRKPRICVERESFDGFAVTWSPAAHATGPNAECAVAVRFNFLSTDFSHSKGVKGIPVRLCAKTYMLHDTEMVAANQDYKAVSSKDVDEKLREQPVDAEVAYCKVKLFRDHGAERKLTNDVAHVKKSIEKLKNQVHQLESGIKETGRRKRTSISLGKLEGERPAKLPKHKRTWSISSTGSSGQAPGSGSNSKLSAEEDLNEKLASLQEMFSSTRVASVLFLKGDEEDDMDSFPVSLPGETEANLQEGHRTGSFDQRTTDDRSRSNSASSSPKTLPRASAETSAPTFPVSAAPTKIDCGSSIIEAVDLNPGYTGPLVPIEKAIACIYTKEKGSQGYYKAVYLWSRNCSELLSRVCQKNGLDTSLVSSLLRVNMDGLEVEFDDEMVEQLPEGQDIIFSLESTVTGVKEEAPTPCGRPPDLFDMSILKLYY